MKKTEKLRQVVAGALAEAELKLRTDQGWKLVAVEWEREIETPPDQPVQPAAGATRSLPTDVPFGLEVSPQGQKLEESPSERELLFQLMELMVQEGSYARIAEEINRRGFRTREGTAWTPISIFEMLPRLIEVGPHVFQSPEWQKRRQKAL